MKTNQLVTIFESLKNSTIPLYFGELMRKGYNSTIIFNAVAKVGARIVKDIKGYSVIIFN